MKKSKKLPADLMGDLEDPTPLTNMVELASPFLERISDDWKARHPGHTLLENVTYRTSINVRCYKAIRAAFRRRRGNFNMKNMALSQARSKILSKRLADLTGVMPSDEERDALIIRAAILMLEMYDLISND